MSYLSSNRPSIRNSGATCLIVGLLCLLAVAPARAQESTPALIESLRTATEGESAALSAQLLGRTPAKLRSHRDALFTLAREGFTPEARRTAWACLMDSEDSLNEVLVVTGASSRYLTDLFDAVPLASNRESLEELYKITTKLLLEVPTAISREEKLYGKEIEILTEDLSFPIADLQVKVTGGGLPLSFQASRFSQAPKGDLPTRIGLRLSFPSPRPIDLLEWRMPTGDQPQSPLELIIEDSLGKVMRREAIPPGKATNYRLEGTGDPTLVVQHAVLRSLPHFEGHEKDAFGMLVRQTMKEKHTAVAFASALEIPEQYWDEGHFMWLAEAAIKLSMDNPAANRFSQEHANRMLLAERIGPKLREQSHEALKRVLNRFPVAYRFRIEPAKLALGRDLFRQHCATCHSEPKSGAPVLDGSRWVHGDPGRAGLVLLNGLPSAGKSKGEPPAMGCPSFRDTLSHDEMAGVLTYIRNAWGNDAPEVDTHFVARLAEFTLPDGKSLPLNTRARILEHYPLGIPEGVAHLPGKPDAPHVVFITGDEEYRSEESMPLLARLLNQHFGYAVTVCFSLDKQGRIDPNNALSITGMEALGDADLMVLFTRFRELPEGQFRHFLDYVQSGRPVVGFRTATHAFKYPDNHPNAQWGWKGDKIADLLGQNWITHHGHFGDGHEFLTEVSIDAGNLGHPILKGITPFKAYSWLYHIDGNGYPVHGPITALMSGRALKSKAADKGFPMTNPTAWTKTYAAAPGKEARVFFSTTAHPFDFKEPAMVRLAINGILWALGNEDDIPDRSVQYSIEGYDPNNSGFGEKFKKGLRPEEMLLHSERFSGTRGD